MTAADGLLLSSPASQAALQAMAWRHALALDVWLHLGIVLMLFGAMWWAGAGLSLAWRRPLQWMGSYNLLEGLACVLAGLSDPASVGGQWTLALAHALTVPAYVMMWQAGALGTGAPERRAEKKLVVALGLLTMGALAMVQGIEAGALNGSFLATAYVAARGGLEVGRRMRLGGQAAGRVVQVLGLLCAAALAARGGAGLVLDLNGPSGDALMRPVAHVTATTGVLLNVVVAYVVFGRVMHALERLSGDRPLGGLLQRPALDRLLAHEAVQHQRRGRRMAVLVLALPDLDALRASHGEATAQAVRAEVVLHLRVGMSPSDALGQLDDGRFVLCMFDTTEALAASAAHALERRIGADRGLHPDADRPLRLRLGMALAGPGQPVDEALAQATARCGGSAPA